MSFVTSTSLTVAGGGGDLLGIPVDLSSSFCESFITMQKIEVNKKTSNINCRVRARERFHLLHSND